MSLGGWLGRSRRTRFALRCRLALWDPGRPLHSNERIHLDTGVAGGGAACSAPPPKCAEDGVQQPRSRADAAMWITCIVCDPQQQQHLCLPRRQSVPSTEQPNRQAFTSYGTHCRPGTTRRCRAVLLGEDERHPGRARVACRLAGKGLHFAQAVPQGGDAADSGDPGGHLLLGSRHGPRGHAALGPRTTSRGPPRPGTRRLRSSGTRTTSATSSTMAATRSSNSKTSQPPVRNQAPQINLA